MAEIATMNPTSLKSKPEGVNQSLTAWYVHCPTLQPLMMTGFNSYQNADTELLGLGKGDGSSASNLVLDHDDSTRMYVAKLGDGVTRTVYIYQDSTGLLTGKQHLQQHNGLTNQSEIDR